MTNRQPRSEQHRRADFAGERALRQVIHVLGPQRHRRIAERLPHGLQINKRRADHQVELRKIDRSLGDARGQGDGRGTVGVHLPVAGDEGASHGGGFLGGCNR